MGDDKDSDYTDCGYSCDCVVCREHNKTEYFKDYKPNYIKEFIYITLGLALLGIASFYF